MSDLSNSAIELREHGEAIIELSETFKEFFRKENEQPEVTQMEFVTLEQVRAVLAEKSRAGHTEAVRELLLKHGAKKLSEIKPEKYSELLSDAEALADG